MFLIFTKTNRSISNNISYFAKLAVNVYHQEAPHFVANFKTWHKDGVKGG